MTQYRRVRRGETPKENLIIFVCTGNTCRSPMAEVFANDWLRRHCPNCTSQWRIASAGISALTGVPASEGACEAVRVAGLSLNDHRTRRFSAADAEGALVLTMTRAQAAVARKIAPRSRVMTVSAWAGGPEADICDPYCGGAAEYSACSTQLRRLINQGFRRMIRSLPGDPEADGNEVSGQSASEAEPEP